MTFRYNFDGGKEKPLKCPTSLYGLAALYAFAKEHVEKLPPVSYGVHDYDGHILKIWSPKVMPEYGPYWYGIGLNEAQSVTIVPLSEPR